MENSWEEFDLAQLIIKKTPTHTYEKWKCYSGIKSEAVSTELKLKSYRLENQMLKSRRQRISKNRWEFS